MLRLDAGAHALMVAHCLDGLPFEACGLLGGRPAPAKANPGADAGSAEANASANAETDTAEAVVCYPCRNAAASARVYEVDPRDYLRADRDAESRGLEIVGVFHSHTHTGAYPSGTDVAQAFDPGWHYLVVSLAQGVSVTRSFRIVEGNVTEEPVVLVGR